MIDADGVSRLLRLQAGDRPVVSVYVTVPLDPAQRRGLAARVEDVLAADGELIADQQALAQVRRLELPVIRRAVTSHAHEWLGHSVAIFACAQLGLLDTIPLRGPVGERAAIGARPYVRPLLAELQRSPSYVTVVVDRRHAWLYRISPDATQPLGRLLGETVGSRRFGGWHGFQAYRNEQRARNLARRHYAATIAALTASPEAAGLRIVVGGHEAETSAFTTLLPPALRERVSGTFVIDPHTMTPARVRQFADEVMARWEDERERRVAAAVTRQTPGTGSAIGLADCLAAANQHAIDLLVVPDDEVRPGFECARCGGLTIAAGPCPVCAGTTRPVVDVIEELAVKVTRDGGEIEPVRDPAVLPDVAARRRFPAPG